LGGKGFERGKCDFEYINPSTSQRGPTESLSIESGRVRAAGGVACQGGGGSGRQFSDGPLFGHRPYTLEEAPLGGRQAPTNQRLPSLSRLCTPVTQWAHHSSHGCGCQQRKPIKSERPRDGHCRIQAFREYLSWGHHGDGSASLALVPTKFNHSDARRARGVRGAPELSLPKSMAVQNNPLAHRSARAVAGWTLGRSNLANGGNSFFPRLDVDFTSYDSSDASGLLVHFDSGHDLEACLQHVPGHLSRLRRARSDAPMPRLLLVRVPQLFRYTRNQHIDGV